MSTIDALLLTCEHGGARVPTAHRALFTRRAAMLRSHLGYDPGALDMARHLARHLRAPLIASTTTRLLVDLNRSPHHPRVFSEITRALDAPSRDALLRRYHAPHWAKVERALQRHARAGRRVLHVAVHSFTPVLHGTRRNCDVGLLYDPQRRPETRFCLDWQAHLRRGTPRLRVRRNYPYRGSDDGLTTAMRRRFGPRRYCGIELEINQEWWLAQAPRAWAMLRRRILDSLRAALAERH